MSCPSCTGRVAPSNVRMYSENLPQVYTAMSCTSQLVLDALLLLLISQSVTSFITIGDGSQPCMQPRHETRFFSSTASTSASTSPLSPVTGPPAIILDNLTCSHDGGNTYQLDGVAYNLPRGSKIGLVGRNGCGKVSFGVSHILARFCFWTPFSLFSRASLFFLSRSFNIYMEVVYVVEDTCRILQCNG